MEMFGEELCCGFGDEDVVAVLDGVESDWIVSWIGGEDCHGGFWGKRIDGKFVGVGVGGGVGGEGLEGDVEVVVDVLDVVGKMGTDGWIFLTRGTDHGEGGDFASTTEVEHC